MKQTRQKMMADYFARKPPTIFWLGDIPRLLRDVQIKCHDLGLSGDQLLQFLHDEKLLVKAEFRSSNYPILLCFRQQTSRRQRMSRKTVDGIVSDSEDVRLALTSADQIGKVFVALGQGSRGCLICDEVLTQHDAVEHAKRVCHPR